MYVCIYFHVFSSLLSNYLIVFHLHGYIVGGSFNSHGFFEPMTIEENLSKKEPLERLLIREKNGISIDD